MIYHTKSGTLQYYIAEVSGTLFYDCYHFDTMKRTPQAVQTAINELVLRLGLEEFEGDEHRDGFNLILDFLGNKRIPLFDNDIENVRQYFTERGLECTVQEIPLQFIIHNLRINDLTDIINDVNFQAIKAPHLYARWKVLPVN